MAIGKPLVVGMGRVGSLIALLLSELGMQVVGVDMEQGSSIPAHVECVSADVTDPRILARLCHGRDAVIVCLPYHLILGAAQVAHTSGMHYFDLTEDVVTTHAIRMLAVSAGAVMIPQNGLAPGFIGMVGAYLAQQFDLGTLWQLKLRVGALPQHPMGQLGYAVNWSPEGLLRSYTMACDVLVHASAQGYKHGSLQTQALVIEYHPIEMGNRTRTTIARTTAASLVAVVELMSSGTLPQRGYGWPEDLERTEDGGCFRGADVSKISHKAIARGFDQIGPLGSGNHYIEIQVVHPEYVYDAALAQQFGITMPEQVVVMFHCGSRGFGYQVATDYLQVFLKVMQTKYGIPLLDRELACAPFHAPEGQDYFAAMQGAANMAFANRQVILHRIREVFSDLWQRDPVELGLHMVYDVAHNTAKLEEHEVDGERRQLLVHRKGLPEPSAQAIPACRPVTSRPDSR